MNETELLFSTIQSGNVSHLKAQIERNPDLVNTKDARGFTPLIFAAYFNKETIVKVLVEHNAEINAKDAAGNTALIGVSFKGDTAIAKLLIKNGANINAQNRQGTTPLMYAAMYNQEQIIKILLDNNAVKTIKDENDKTAYDHAVEKGFENLKTILE